LAQAGQRWEEVVKKALACWADGNITTYWFASGFESFDPPGEGTLILSP
jgi:hypothetical protein